MMMSHGIYDYRLVAPLAVLAVSALVFGILFIAKWLRRYAPRRRSSRSRPSPKPLQPSFGPLVLMVPWTLWESSYTSTAAFPKGKE